MKTSKILLVLLLTINILVDAIYMYYFYVGLYEKVVFPNKAEYFMASILPFTILFSLVYLRLNYRRHKKMDRVVVLLTLMVIVMMFAKAMDLGPCYLCLPEPTEPNLFE